MRPFIEEDFVEEVMINPENGEYTDPPKTVDDEMEEKYTEMALTWARNPEVSQREKYLALQQSLYWQGREYALDLNIRPEEVLKSELYQCSSAFRNGYDRCQSEINNKYKK